MTRAQKAAESAADGRRPSRSRVLALSYPARRRTSVDVEEGSTTPDSLQSRRTSSESLRSHQRSPSIQDRDCTTQAVDVEQANFAAQLQRPSTLSSADGIASRTHPQLRVAPLQGVTLMSPIQDQADTTQSFPTAESSAPTLPSSTPAPPDGPAAPDHLQSPVCPPRGTTVTAPADPQGENAHHSQVIGSGGQEKRFQLHCPEHDWSA